MLNDSPGFRNTTEPFVGETCFAMSSAGSFTLPTVLVLAVVVNGCFTLASCGSFVSPGGGRTPEPSIVCGDDSVCWIGQR